jgi:putative transcriptional regulator
MNDKDFKLMRESLKQVVEIKKGKKLHGMRESYRQKPATAQEVKGIRKTLHLTQAGFAGVVGASPNAVEHWEQGIRRPSGSASKLIRILKSHPELISEMR